MVDKWTVFLECDALSHNTCQRNAVYYWPIWPSWLSGSLCKCDQQSQSRSQEISAFPSPEETPWEQGFPALHQAKNNAPRFVYVFSESLCFQPLP